MLKKIFVVSPLSSEKIDELVSKYEYQFEQITCTFLKNIGIASTIRLLRSLKDMTVVFEDQKSEQLTDIFLLLFAFTKAKNINFIKEDFSTFSLGKKDIPLVLLKNMWSLIFGFYCTIKMFFLSKTLSSHNSIPIIKNAKEILYIKPTFWFGVKAGGSIAHVEGVISGFKNLGYQIDYAAIDCPGSLKFLTNNYFSLSIPKFLSHIVSFNLSLFDNYNYKLLKKKDLRKYKFIYSRMALNNLSSMLLARRFKVPLILEYNGSEVWVQKNWGKPIEFERVAQSIEDSILSYASYIITVSNVLKQELMAKGLPEEKIICYPNCVNPKKFNSELFTEKQLTLQREKLGFSKDDIVLTFVGTFGKWHGVEILAQTICRLYNEDSKWLQGKHVKFMMVGDGACMPEVKNILASVPNYSSFVTLSGLIKQEEAPIYLALSDILLSPHCSPNKNDRFFGSPTKLFEYMAMNKVIIASDLEQIGEVLSPSIHIDNIERLNHTSLSILCNQGDIVGLGKAIRYAVDNLPTLCFMGKKAQEKVFEHYTWDKHVQYIIDKISSKEK